MAKNKRISEIDIDQDMVYQEREWRIQRAGWLLMWLVILAALLGVFGKGVLANAVASDPGGALTVKYSRFERNRSPSALEVTIGPVQTTGGKFAIALDRDFVNRIEIQRMDPEPASVKGDREHVVYEFEVTEAGQPAEVVIDYEHAQFGLPHTRLALENGPEVLLRQVVYP